MADRDLTVPTLRVVAPKPKMTVYFALLILSLLAMLTGCIFLYMEIGRFGGFGTVQGGVSSLVRPAPLLHADARIVHEVERS